MSRYRRSSKSMSCLKVHPIKNSSPERVVPKIFSARPENTKPFRAADSIRLPKPERSKASNKISLSSFNPGNRYYIQLSPCPSNYDLKGKSTQKDMSSLAKIINYEKINKIAADVHLHLKSFIIKSVQHKLAQRIEALEKNQRNRFKHPKGEEFLKEVKHGNSEKVGKMLMEHPELVKVTDFTNQTPLHWACKRGHLEIAKQLIASKANIFALDSVGRGAEEIARSKGHTEIVLYIISSKRLVRHNSLRQNSNLIPE